MAENTISGRERLQELANSGCFVFHGSSKRLERLEPRQSTTVDEKKGEIIPDGDPAVCATDKLDIAIFRSLISSHIAHEAGLGSHTSSFGLKDDGGIGFRSTKNSLEHAHDPNTIGFVHVFNKSDFYERNQLEWRSGHPVIPVEIVEVKGKDLPENIEVIELPK